MNWLRIERVYDEIVEQPPEEREQFLNAACALDPPEVRAKVEEWLRLPRDDDESWFNAWIGEVKNEVGEIVSRAPDERRENKPEIRIKVLPSSDLQELLRRRLCFACALIAGLYAVYLLKIAMYYEGYRFEQYTFGNWVAFVLVHTTTFACASFTALFLRSKIRLSVRHLRIIELVIVGLPLLDQSWLEYQRFFREHRLLLLLQTETNPIASGRTHVLPWFVLIVFYGVLIPNTGRRCFAVISALAGAALAINLVAAIADGVIRQPAVLHHILEVSLWLGFAIAFTVYNAYRIEQLQRFAGYRLGKKLGEGGVGVVYHAVNELLQRSCVIKLIRPEKANDPKILEIFENGAAKAAQLIHPNIIEIFDYGRADDGRFYYAMEYLDGPNLDDMVENGRHPLPPGRVIFLLRQVCSALAKAHAAGLVHRDIKPSNIIVCMCGKQPDVAKLLDFDLVADQDARLASPGFASPEQKMRCKTDHRSDLYSLGATAYFLLTGKTFDQSDDSWGDVPAGLQAVVRRCLETDRAQRFQSAEEVEQALAACAC